MNGKIIEALLLIGTIIGYELIWGIATLVWQRWAEEKAGQFWDYSLKEGKRLYFPGWTEFEKNHRILYRVAKPICWPITLIGDTTALRRVTDQRHYYW